MKGFSNSWWMLGLIVVVIVIFIVSSISSRKRKKLEKDKRQKEVKNVIKRFMRNELRLQHKILEFDQVVGRSSKDYRYRDVFDVIIKLYDSKTNELYATKAFEVEGFTKQLTKKEYETIWKVNCEENLEETLKRIEVQKKRRKTIKKNDPEMKKLIAEEKKAIKENIEEERKLKKQAKVDRKNPQKPRVPLSEKFSGFKETTK